MPRSTGSPPASRTSPASAGAQASRTWPGSSTGVAPGTTSSPVETIPTRGRACAAIDVIPAAASSPRSAARSGPPGRREHVARPRLLARVQDAVARCDPAQQLDVTRHRLGRVLDHHDRVGAVREQPARRDAHRRAGTDLALGRAAHRDRAGDLEERGQRLRRRVRVDRAHRVAVDGRARVCGQLLRRADVPRRHRAERGSDVRDRAAPRRSERVERLGDGHDREEHRGAQPMGAGSRAR